MEEKSLKIREKGITLIALVITIIVLLILAGVSIAMLTGENGILTQAQNAKEKSSVAEEKEKIALAYNGVKAKEKGGAVTYDELNKEFEASKTDATATEEGSKIKVKFNDTNREYIIDENGNITEAGTGSGTVTPPTKPTIDENGLFENTSTINGEPGTAMNPTIPEGFRPIDTETSTWGDGTNPPSTTSVNNGLVIEDINGSQFVWIPVPTPVSTTEEAGTENKAMAIKDDNNYIALLYDFSESGSTVQEGCSSSENYNTILNSREPAYLTHETEGDESDYNQDGSGTQIVTQVSMQNEYNAMMTSVEKYKGFYVARYELGMEGDIPVSKSQQADPDVSTQIAWENRWYGLYTKCKDYATKNNVSSSVGSSMIWGSQYDAMMNWMQKNNVNVIAEDDTKRSTFEQTGFKAEDILKNIYDLYGCHYEWTLEARSNSLRIVRGGLYHDKSDGDVARTNAPAVRYENAPWHDYGDDSSRITLYVK